MQDHMLSRHLATIMPHSCQGPANMVPQSWVWANFQLFDFTSSACHICQVQPSAGSAFQQAVLVIQICSIDASFGPQNRMLCHLVPQFCSSM